MNPDLNPKHNPNPNQAITWAAHVRELGLSNWLVGATDQRTLRSLRRAGVPCFGMKTALPEGEPA